MDVSTQLNATNTTNTTNDTNIVNSVNDITELTTVIDLLRVKHFDMTTAEGIKKFADIYTKINIEIAKSIQYAKNLNGLCIDILENSDVIMYLLEYKGVVVGLYTNYNNAYVAAHTHFPDNATELTVTETCASELIGKGQGYLLSTVDSVVYGQKSSDNPFFSVLSIIKQ